MGRAARAGAKWGCPPHPPSFFRSLQMSVLSRDLVAAKMAFEVGDPELSKKAHAARAAPEKHSGYLEVSHKTTCLPPL